MSGMVGLFLTVPGVVLLAALDSTIFFALPLGIDAAVILLTARGGASIGVVPLLATAGSLAGAGVTYWMGDSLGDAGIDRAIGKKRLERIRRRLQRSPVAIAALDLLPPPFPFSLCMLAAGAARIDRTRLFGTLALCRLLRFGVDGAVGGLYGRRALHWLDSPTVQRIVLVVVGLAVVASTVSVVRLMTSVRSHRSASVRA